jgi:hypothetical protein
MVRSLFLSNMTFWRYLAARTMHIAYLFARRSVMALAPAGHSTASRIGVPEPFIIERQGAIREIFSGPRDWMRLDSLQVLTKMLNVTPKAAVAKQSDRGERKG